MSDDNKNLGDDLNDMLDDAKDNAKRTGDKISQSAKEFSDDAKRSANEFSANAKRASEDFSNDAKNVFSDGKNVAIIAHITIIGWIIAVVMNGNNKTEFGSFYIRQMLGFIIIAFITSWIPILNLIVWIVLLVAWIMSLIAAMGGEMKESFLFGKQFQEWFKSL